MVVPIIIAVILGAAMIYGLETSEEMVPAWRNTDESIKVRRLNLLNETIRHYNSKNISVSENGSCRYKGPNGKRCAIARIVPESVIDKLFEGQSVTAQMNKLPYHVKSLGEMFLYNLQRLHDNEFNWDEKGITELGLKQVEYIKQEHCK